MGSVGIIRRIGFALLGLILGGAIGGGAGLLSGLLYAHLANTPSFEGLSGHVVVFWMLGGIVLGLLTGTVLGWRFARRRQASLQH